MQAADLAEADHLAFQEEEPSQEEEGLFHIQLVLGAVQEGLDGHIPAGPRQAAVMGQAEQHLALVAPEGHEEGLDHHILLQAMEQVQVVQEEDFFQPLEVLVEGGHPLGLVVGEHHILLQEEPQVGLLLEHQGGQLLHQEVPHLVDSEQIP